MLTRCTNREGINFAGLEKYRQGLIYPSTRATLEYWLPQSHETLEVISANSDFLSTYYRVYLFILQIKYLLNASSMPGPKALLKAPVFMSFFFFLMLFSGDRHVIEGE